MHYYAKTLPETHLTNAACLFYEAEAFVGVSLLITYITDFRSGVETESGVA